MIQNATRWHRTSHTELFGNLTHAVDAMHFCGRKDEWCKGNKIDTILIFGLNFLVHMNPNSYPELKDVNSQVCEQKFSYTNHFKNVKSMNHERYRFYWLYIMDLKNLYIEKKLGKVSLY